MIWDSFLQLLPKTYSSCISLFFSSLGTSAVLKTFVDYTIDFSISLSSFNDRNSIAKELFSHLLPHLPMLQISYSSLLGRLLHYQSINSNLPGTLLQLSSYLTAYEDFVDVLKYPLNLTFEIGL